MLSRIELEEMSFADLKDLVKKTGQSIPQHAKADVLVDLMEGFYTSKQEELAKKVEAESDGDLPPVAQKEEDPQVLTEANTGKYAGFATKQEYIQHMMTPVLCVITPQAPEFSRQSSDMASVSVGNALIPNREFAFIADGNTVTSIPRIALGRIRESKVLLKGSSQLNKTKMKSNTQGSAFGMRYRVHELTPVEIEAYKAEKKNGGNASDYEVGTGL
ncbi:hypothetical protein HOU79_gp57 [Vibrio phage 1.224.A._10N.261.48.B1]|uniref:Uncharacterized protein n=1 Tax=Vibrio phage 1.224.A._10N.261.48.B1 TaxID=1881226 RepID=A0A2I7RRY5_9CAUD|nr:hypothetical protein HOU79_gp57 [Vibrio phage 1.224.A._10N.261.48.B1]AUR96416.1 hypothetical protein NVP1224A_49 [Vibrio phage 1.224.A._10N.261.48.B1]